MSTWQTMEADAREELIMRAIAQADERNGAAPYDHRITMGKHALEALRDEAREVLAELRKCEAIIPTNAPDPEITKAAYLGDTEALWAIAAEAHSRSDDERLPIDVSRLLRNCGTAIGALLVRFTAPPSDTNAPKET
jgi:hypothetical protein